MTNGAREWWRSRIKGILFTQPSKAIIRFKIPDSSEEPVKQKMPIILSKQTLLCQTPFAELQVAGLELQIAGSLSEKKLSTLEEPLAKISSRLILKKERAHRAGKTVLVVTGFSSKISEEVINSLAKEAKVACGCGGTVISRNIELQGDQPQRVRKFFESKGFRVDGIH